MRLRTYGQIHFPELGTEEGTLFCVTYPRKRTKKQRQFQLTTKIYLLVKLGVVCPRRKFYRKQFTCLVRAQFASYL